MRKVATVKKKRKALDGNSFGFLSGSSPLLDEGHPVLFVLHLLLTASVQLPLMTSLLNRAACGSSSRHPDSCISTSALDLRPMFVRCCPMSRTTSCSVLESPDRRGIFLRRAEVTVEESIPSPSSKSLEEVEHSSPLRCLWWCEFLWIFIPLPSPPLLLAESAVGLPTSVAEEDFFLVGSRVLLLPLALLCCCSSSTPLVIISAADASFVCLTRFLGGDREDIRPAPRPYDNGSDDDGSNMRGAYEALEREGVREAPYLARRRGTIR